MCGKTTFCPFPLFFNLSFSPTVQYTLDPPLSTVRSTPETCPPPLSGPIPRLRYLHQRSYIVTCIIISIILGVVSSIFFFTINVLFLTMISTAGNRHKQNSRFCKEIREDNFRFWWRRVHDDASQGMYMSKIEICFFTARILQNQRMLCCGECFHD
jgi:hypothetical protein